MLVKQESIRYYSWVFYFKDYNTAIQISGKKRNFQRFWWLVPQKTENGFFSGNLIKKVSHRSGTKLEITEAVLILLV